MTRQESTPDHTACQATHNALYEAAVECLENPHPFMPSREYFDYRLGTYGHAYTISGWQDVLEENKRLREALTGIANTLALVGADVNLDYIEAVARKALEDQRA